MNRPTRFHAFSALATALLAGLGVGRAEEPPPSYYEQTLREKRIEPTAGKLVRYFKSLHPDEAYRQRVAQLIRDLGSTESFAKREEAMAQLMVLPRPPREALTAAAAGKDPEVRWRAKQILPTATAESERVLYAALRVSEEKKLPGLTVELIRAVALCDKPHLVYAVGEAMRAVARADDADMLRRALKSKDAQLRAAAAGALGKALGREAADDLQALIDDPQDKVKVAAARALANLGDRRSLTALVGLLSADDLNVRVAAAVTLRALTGKDFAYAASDTPAKRAAAITQWKTWLAREGRTAKLNLPLKPLGAGDGYLNGNTLLAYGYSNRVVEYDPSDREVWSYDAPGAWSAEKMRSGNVLIALYNGKVIQVDPTKKVVWEYACTTPLNAKPLTSGNILIAEFGGNRVIEVTPDKKVVWSYACNGAPTDVHRLASGNTLVSVERAGCREVTPEGKTVWEYTGGKMIYGCQPLPGGNVLLADMAGQVIEVTRGKEVVWQYSCASPCDCFRLPNGNTLIAQHLQFVEVTPDKKVIWLKNGYGYGSARR